MSIGHLDPWGEFPKTVIYSVPGSLDFQHREPEKSEETQAI